MTRHDLQWRRIAGAALLVPTLTLAGCANVVVDADGTRHVTGFMRLVLPPPAATPGADSMRVQTLGVSLILNSAVGNALVLGYGDTTLTVLRNDAQVASTALLAPRPPLSPPEQP